MKINSRHPTETARLDRLIGSKTGLINEVRFENRSRDIESVVYAEVDPADIGDRRSLGDVPPDLGAAGKGKTQTEAMYSAVGEFVERYCTFRRIPRDAIRTASYEDLVEEGARVVDFDYFTHYTESQYRSSSLERATTADELRWVAGTDPVSGATSYLPFWLVASTGESPYGFLSSNGCAAGQSEVDAAFRGIAEVIERDAVMRSWFNGETPDRIDLSDFPRIDSLRRDCEPANGTIHLLRFDSPTAFHTLGAAYLRQDDEKPKFLLAASAHPDFVTAAQDAIVEVTQVVKMYRKLALANDAQPTRQDGPLALGDNAKYYMDPATADRVAWLLEGSTVTPQVDDRTYETDRQLLTTAIETVSDNSMTPILYDFTTRDIRDVGLCVLKACIPELVPLAHPSVAPAGHPSIDEQAVHRPPHPLG